jgi:transcriptional regulator with XRE-family HTH domain
MIDIKVQFGRNVKELRQRKGLSQEALANLCDLDRTYIPGVEKGERNVSLIVIQKIAKGLNVEIKALFE